MAFEFKLPDIGEGVVEGEIVEWLVKEGDEVAEDQPLVAVMTDKATVEIPSPRKGKVVKLGAKAGEIVKVGAVLITLDGEGAAPAAASAGASGASAKAEPPAAKAEASAASKAEQSAAKAEPPAASKPAPAAPKPAEPARAEAPRAEPAAPAPAAEPAASDSDDHEGVVAAPATRKLARELGVDILSVKGTGPRGRVTKEDVESAAQAPRAPRLAAAAAPTAAAAAAAPAAASGAKAAPAAAAEPLMAIPQRSTPGERNETREPVRGLRKKIAEKMQESKRTIPHFAYVDHFDATELVALRTRLKPQAERYGVSLSYMPFILKALVPCLKEFPLVNSMLDERTGELVTKHYYNIGVAADTERGLTVPVVQDVDRKSILEIAAEITELVERARAGRSRLEDLQGGTFTVTSTGNIGGLFATPIINHPEVAILGVPKIKRLPWVVDEQIVIRDILHLALCFDHRVVDGAVGARFTNRLIEYLSEPSRIFLELA